MKLDIVLRRVLLTVAILIQSVVGQTLLRPLVTQSIDENKLTMLAGNTHPLARPDYDQGYAPLTMRMNRMLLVLKRRPTQEAALRHLLDDQQDKTSASYHKWLSPYEFGQRFGVADQDIQTVTTWLQSHGLHVLRISKGRSIIEFSGAVADVQQAFHTSMHKYLVNGEEHWANANNPQIPEALVPVVSGVASLNNFPRKPLHVIAGIFSKSKATGRVTAVRPEFTFNGLCDQDNNCYALGPSDFATIYNLLPIWSTGIDGTGQSIAIVGQTNINIHDVRDFRSSFGLAANDPQIILNGPDPGLTSDETEADLDIQWSGAVAPKATIKFVTSQTTEATAGIDLSAEYIIDNNIASVMSESYGSCELALGTAGNQFYSTLWEQATAQGITVLVSSGDSGSAGCDFNFGSAPQPAQFGLAVNGIGSTPFNVSVGGTDFNDLVNPQTYWNTTNDPTTQVSAKGYIPETTWNDSCTNTVLLGNLGYGTNAEADCNDPRLVFQVFTIGGSGGASNCTTNNQAPGSCSGGYSKPSWQAGIGIPADGKRDLPDVSLFAGDGINGNFYVVCEADATQSPNCGITFPFNFLGVGGTSASSPAFAGIMALVNQKTGSRQGNANYVLYRLAAQQNPSSCNSSTGPASSCIFNDITAGTIAMACSPGSPNCAVNVAGDQYGVLSGYSTTSGYDLATGLGSVNAANLVNQWDTIAFTPTTTTLTLTPTNLTHGQTVNVTIAVSPNGGTGNPAGDVSLVSSAGPGIDGFTLNNGAVTATTSFLLGGTYSVIAHYAGDGVFGSSDSSPVSVTVGKENSKVTAFLITFDKKGNLINPNTTTAPYGSPYLLRSNVTNPSGSTCGPLGGCPTGNVVLTDNGAPLDQGTYTLNSLGYFEDPLVQLPGGTNNVQAQYGGDNSFVASSVVVPLLIAPAVTSLSNITSFNATVNVPFVINTTVDTQSSGAAPTGTFTFLDNGQPSPGTLTTQSYPGGPGFSNNAYEIVAYQTSVTSVGNHAITVSYSGDSSYAGSSTSTTITARYGSTISLTPASLTVQPGTNVTLTALVDTSNKNLAPTGSIAFSGSPLPLKATVPLTPVLDSNGNSAGQATFSFVASADEVVGAQYNGDTNYYSGSAGSIITVPGSDFALAITPAAVGVTPGGTASVVVQIGAQAGYTGTVSFTPASCSGLPAESTCAFTNATITGSGAASLTIATTGPHALIGRKVSSKSIFWYPQGLGLAMGVALFSSARKKRFISAAKLFAAMLLLTAGIACGGGGSSAGGGSGGRLDPGTPRGTYTVTVTANSGTLMHTASFTLNVQ